MAFSRKRGRPKVEKEKNDYGTLELRNKRLLELTTEPLDLCLKKQLIKLEEHEAGIRLRWLYTLKFGSPDISAYSFEPAGSSCFRNDDKEWLSARHVEYENAIYAIQKANAKRIVMNICIFNQRANFLLPYHQEITPIEAKNRRSEFDKFKEGIEILAKSLGKKSSI